MPLLFPVGVVFSRGEFLVGEDSYRIFVGSKGGFSEGIFLTLNIFKGVEISFSFYFFRGVSTFLWGVSFYKNSLFLLGDGFSICISILSTTFSLHRCTFFMFIFQKQKENQSY